MLDMTSVSDAGIITKDVPRTKKKKYMSKCQFSMTKHTSIMTYLLFLQPVLSSRPSEAGGEISDRKTEDYDLQKTAGRRISGPRVKNPV